MKRTVTLLGLSLMFLATVAFAQREGEGKHVRFSQGPDITNITGENATMSWASENNRADQVRFREAGSNYGWQSASAGGGGTSRVARLRGLRPGRTYEWQILERDGDLLGSGQFRTANRRHDRAPDVLAASYRENDRNDNRDRDHDNQGRGPGGRDNGGNLVPLHRGVERNGAHMYSTNPDDFAGGGYRSEGATGSLMGSQERGTTPLYRMVSSDGDTFLTSNAEQRDGAISQGYRDMGIVGYIATSQLPGTTPFFRLYNPSSHQHLFTTSEQEQNEALHHGWNDESIAGYIWR